jgi:cyclopropane fatty-acyl-phospholipid synthase-like methyltransferase
MIDARKNAPATERNRDYILKVLQSFVPADASVLEIASGSGQHATHFAKHFPEARWQPSDLSAENRASIDAWAQAEQVTNIQPALTLDVHQQPWPVAHADVVVCINMIHIAPWTACEHLLRGAHQIVPTGGWLFLYGPYHQNGKPTSPSNHEFDQWLQSQDPSWGVRDMEKVIQAAQEQQFVLEQCVPMPANNFSLVFRRTVD